jgi:hypothetical protein
MEFAVLSVGMTTPLDCHVWSMKESGRNVFASRLLRRIRLVCDVNVPVDSKNKGVCLGRAEFISLRIPTSGGLCAHVINTVSQI